MYVCNYILCVHTYVQLLVHNTVQYVQYSIIVYCYQYKQYKNYILRIYVRTVRMYVNIYQNTYVCMYVYIL